MRKNLDICKQVVAWYHGSHRFTQDVSVEYVDIFSTLLLDAKSTPRDCKPAEVADFLLHWPYTSFNTIYQNVVELAVLTKRPAAFRLLLSNGIYYGILSKISWEDRIILMPPRFRVAESNGRCIEGCVCNDESNVDSGRILTCLASDTISCMEILYNGNRSDDFCKLVDGLTLVRIASWADKSVMQYFIKRHVEPGSTYIQLNSALRFAVGNFSKRTFINLERIIRILVECGANPNERFPDGQMLLHIAKDKPVIEALIRYGSDVNAQDLEGRTPLHCARSADIANTLIQHGSNANAKNAVGKTPLHDAFTPPITEFLILYGAEIDAPDNEGRTPLHEAASRGELPMVMLLLNNHADPNYMDNKGLTPLHIAVSSGSKCLHLEDRQNFRNIQTALLRSGAELTIPERCQEDVNWSAEILKMLSELKFLGEPHSRPISNGPNLETEAGLPVELEVELPSNGSALKAEEGLPPKSKAELSSDELCFLKEVVILCDSDNDSEVVWED